MRRQKLGHTETAIFIVTTVTWAVENDSLGWDDTKGEEEGKTV